MQKLSVKTIVAIGIGAAIFFLLARFVSIPVFANTYIALQYALLGFFAVVFGPVAGLLIGLIGHMLTDLTYGGLWWSWIIVSALVGFASGLILKGYDIESGVFGKKQILRFVIGSAVIHMIGWGLIAPLLDMLIYAEPLSKTFTQGLIAGIANTLTTAVVGTLLLIAYSKTRTRSGSLSKQ